jgi:hypothetical protein
VSPLWGKQRIQRERAGKRGPAAAPAVDIVGQRVARIGVQCRALRPQLLCFRSLLLLQQETIVQPFDLCRRVNTVSRGP